MSDDFPHFVATEGPRLLRVAVLLCGRESDAEDLLQEVLIKMYPRWSKLKDEQPAAYARRALGNRVISARRSPWHRRRVAHVPDLPVPSDDAARADDRAMLLAALRSLPPRMRAVLVLRYWLGYSERETADELNCSTGTVKSQASRGVERLRELIPAGDRP